jgi:hypothetical protein
MKDVFVYRSCEKKMCIRLASVIAMYELDNETCFCIYIYIYIYKLSKHY